MEPASTARFDIYFLKFNERVEFIEFEYLCVKEPRIKEFISAVFNIEPTQEFYLKKSNGVIVPAYCLAPPNDYTTPYEIVLVKKPRSKILNRFFSSSVKCRPKPKRV